MLLLFGQIATSVSYALSYYWRLERWISDYRLTAIPDCSSWTRLDVTTPEAVDQLRDGIVVASAWRRRIISC